MRQTTLERLLVVQVRVHPFSTDVQADCYLTGEMSHHDVLAAQAAGSSVILSEHTHTERGFLPLYQSIIQKALNAPVELIISKQDKDPLYLK